MRYIINTLLSDWQNTLVRVISLALGLAMGTFLLVKVAKESSYDTCFNRPDRIAQVWSTTLIGGDLIVGEQGFGLLAGAIAENMPDVVESATIVAERPGVTRADGMEFDVAAISSDSSFFKTMGVRVIEGDPASLSVPNKVFLSDRLASEMFGDIEKAMGQIITVSRFENQTVAGIFEDYGDETTVAAHAIFSQSTHEAAGMDGLSWLGATWWRTYIRLRDGISPEDLDGRIEMIVKQNVPDTETIGWGAYARPLRDTYSGRQEVRQVCRTLSILAILVLIITIFNYVLLSLSAIHRRSKAIGILKCCGSGRGGIFRLFMTETAVIVLAASVLAAIIWWLTKEFAFDTIYTNITSAVSLSRLWVIVAVVLTVFVISGVVPAVAYSRISPSHLFRKTLSGNKLWKQLLLFVENAGAALACSMLALVMFQYHTLTDAKLGFNPERLVVVRGHKPENIDVVLKSYLSLPYVSMATVSTAVPGYGGYEGELARINGRESNLLSKSDMWQPGYADKMGIKILYGHEPEREGEIAVNRKFASEIASSPDKAIGMQMRGAWSNDQETIVGVIDDFRFRNLYVAVGPMFVYSLPEKPWRIFITLRVDEPMILNTEKLVEEIGRLYPGDKISVFNLSEEIRRSYAPVKEFALMTAIGSVIILFIALSGLIGYLCDEMRRRTKEIAVRRINGASVYDIVRLFTFRIIAVCAAGLMTGGVLAWIFSHEWLEQFQLKVEMPELIIAGSVTALLAVVWLVAVLVARHICAENPAHNLRYE